MPRISQLSTEIPTSVSVLPGNVGSTTKGFTADQLVGFWSTVQGDMVYAAGTRNLSRLAPPSSGSILSYSSATSAPIWSSVTSGGILIGTAAGVPSYLATPTSGAILTYSTASSIPAWTSATSGGILIGSAAGVPGFLAVPTSGAILTYSTASSIPAWTIGTSAQIPTVGAAGAVSWINRRWGISVNIGSSGSTVATDTAAWVEVPFAIGISETKLIAQVSGDLIVDIYANGVSSTPSASGTKITASAPPTLSNAQRSSDSVLTGWTTSIAAGQWLTFDVTGSSTIQKATVILSGRILDVT